MSRPEIARDGTKVAAITSNIGARALHSDHLHAGELAQIASDLFLHADGKISVRAIRTQVLERQHCDRPIFFGGGAPAFVKIESNTKEEGHKPGRDRPSDQSPSARCRPRFESEIRPMNLFKQIASGLRAIR